MFTALLHAIVSLVIVVNGDSAPDEPRPDLNGTVTAEQSGAPVKDATVFIYTAGVRTGTSPFCPSCYPDCGKRATTDEQGHFRIESLDSNLVFRILVVADRYQSQFVPKIEPATGPIEVKLITIDPERLKPGHVLRGRVVDADGDPIVGATVEPTGSERADGAVTFGQIDGLDALGITDRKGEFAITSDSPNLKLYLQVDARGQATKLFHDVQMDDSQHDFKLGPGVLVRGHLMRNGEPVPNVEMGIVQQNRWAEKFTGHINIGTDDHGMFELSNVPPDEDYYLYGIMHTMQSLGAVPVRELHVGAHGWVVDVGSIELEPAHRLQGQVVLSDGGTIPAHTRLLISRQRAWDTLIVELDENGRFDVAGLPTESYGLSVRIKGYCMSAKNASLDLVNSFMLRGKVEADTTNLSILLEPGTMPQIDPAARQRFDMRALDEQPLRGAAK